MHTDLFGAPSVYAYVNKEDDRLLRYWRIGGWSICFQLHEIMNPIFGVFCGCVCVCRTETAY